MAFRRVTVFGGSGFIGRYVVQHLAATGAVVRVAGRDPRDAWYLQPLGNVGQIVPIAADVRDAAGVRAAVEGVDLVINLVGILHESGKATFDAVHHKGAANVARACADAGVKRLVHLSAIGADADSKAEYARSKAAGEAAVRQAYPAAVILRPSIVFGPEDDFFNRFAGMARFSPVLPTFKTRFQPVYVGDVADAVMVASREGTATRRKTYELGGPTVHTFTELMQVMLREIERERMLVSFPAWLLKFNAFFLELAPGKPLLTRDQVRMLADDNVVSPDALSFADMQIVPRSVESILPRYMDIYRRGGRFRSRFA